MRLRTVKIINVIGIFLISFLFHQLYQWFPNRFIAIFFPVNESIFEHLKLIYSAVIFWMLIEYFILQPIKHNNLILASLTTAVATNIIFLVLFLPVYNEIGHDLLITLIIYFIAIVLGQLISYYILTLNTNYKILNLVSLILIPLIFTMLGYLTYHPPKTPFFYDQYQDKYGIYNFYR
ncbi:MAG: DUF6512 family protein [Bacilli bacterium]|jgi:hypothetical protein